MAPCFGYATFVDMETVKDIQNAYINEIRQLKPEMYDFWIKLGRLEKINDAPPEEIVQRWPMGPSGHPKMIEIFQRYFFLIEKYNDENPMDFQKVNQVLIEDVEVIAPDIAKLVLGFVFIPVGMNPQTKKWF